MTDVERHYATCEAGPFESAYWESVFEANEHRLREAEQMHYESLDWTEEQDRQDWTLDLHDHIDGAAS